MPVWLQNGGVVKQNGGVTKCPTCPCGVKWVATGTGANQIYTSLNTDTWTGVSSPFDDFCYKAKNDGNVWVASGGNFGSARFARSDNGKTWNSFNVSGVNATGYGIGFGNNKWLIGGSFAFNVAYESTDRISWVLNNLGFGVGFAWNMEYNETNWLIGGDNGVVLGDSNASNWSVINIVGGRTFEALKWNGSLWMIGGVKESGGYAIFTSPDGASWTGRNSPFDSCRSIDWNGSLAVAVGTGTNAIATSPDGVNWTGRNSPFTSGGGVAYGDNKWVGVGSGAYAIATSPGGVNWTGKTSTLTSGSGVSYKA